MLRVLLGHRGLKKVFYVGNAQPGLLPLESIFRGREISIHIRRTCEVRASTSVGAYYDERFSISDRQSALCAP